MTCFVVDEVKLRPMRHGDIAVEPIPKQLNNPAVQFEAIYLSGARRKSGKDVCYSPAP